jgi:F-type H+-transporting ATPase subunit epsilon
VTVLAESAERRSKIDKNRAEEAMKRAERRLEQKDRKDIDVIRAQAALQRAIHRLRLLTN